MLTVIFYAERKSIRRSTAAKSAATQKRLRERNEDQRRKIKVVKHDIWRPTQEELLEEALQTEELNTKSLGMYKIKYISTIFNYNDILYSGIFPFSDKKQKI